MEREQRGRERKKWGEERRERKEGGGGEGRGGKGEEGRKSGGYFHFHIFYSPLFPTDQDS